MNVIALVHCSIGLDFRHRELGSYQSHFYKSKFENSKTKIVIVGLDRKRPERSDSWKYGGWKVLTLVISISANLRGRHCTSRSLAWRSRVERYCVAFDMLYATMRARSNMRLLKCGECVER